MKRFRITVETGYVGAQHEDEVEFEDEHWEGLSEEERTSSLEECVQTLISNHIEGSWEEL